LSGIKDGGIDSGMGYESIIGAKMKLITITEVDIDGKTFINRDEVLHFFGKLSVEEKKFLSSIRF
jgi:hypothetical protein